MTTLNIAKTGVLVVVVAFLPRTTLGQPTTINVEIDFMADATHSHRPQQAEINAAVQMFACHGITLNVVIDDQIGHINTMRCTTLPSTCQGDTTFFSCSNPNSFATIKANNFDNAGGGWHYCVFGHQYDCGSGTGSSGLAEVGGDDLLVTLASFAGGIGTAWDRAATFVHELGHNLGLRHATGQTGVGNFKPNYASVMSYQYQLRGVRRQLVCLGLADQTSLFKELDYSNGRLPTIDERALSEAIGVGIHNVDWDCDGSLDGGTVAQDLDGRPWCTRTGTRGTLSDYNDWDNLVDNTLLARQEEIQWPITTCITADEADTAVEFLEQMRDLPNPNNCPVGQPAVVSEGCVSGLMIWADPSYFGTEDGTGDKPYNTIAEAYNAAPRNSVLHLQPGTYTNGGVSLTLTKRLTIAGPGGAVIDP